MKNNESYIKYSELPDCIKGQIITFGIICVGLFGFGISVAIGRQSFRMFLLTLGILLSFLVYCFSWCLPFFLNKVIIIEGNVIEIEENEKTKKGLTGIVARELTRYTFTIDVDGKEVTVIKTGSKVKKAGTHLVLYVPESAIHDRNDGTIFINNVLYTEIIK